MKFNNNSNNNARDAVNVNTRGIQLSNSEGFMPSTMVFGFWNSMISIKIHPALERVNNQTHVDSIMMRLLQQLLH